MMTRQNIVILIANIELAGGTERAVVNLANDLSEYGYSIKIVSIFSKSGNSFYPLSSNIMVEHLGVIFQNNLASRVLKGFKNLYSSLKKLYSSSKDVTFIATDPFVSFVTARLHSSSSNNKLIVCEHMALSISKFYSVWFRKLFLRKVDNIVVLTNRDKTFINRILPNTRCEVIPNRVSFLPEKLSDCASKVLLAIGRLEAQKNLGELIEICKPILDTHADWRLRIIGDGSQKMALLQQIDSLNLKDKIEILPPTNDIGSQFLGSSIFVMSSIYEGFPMVLLEAKSYGLPIISYDCPNGPKEMITPSKDGFLIQMHDKENFRIALNELINSVDERIAFGIVGRSMVKKNYSKVEIISLWEKTLNSL